MASSFRSHLTVFVASIAALVPISAARAQTVSSVAIVIDSGALDIGPVPHAIAPDAANASLAAVGVREPLPFFAQRLGHVLSLRTGPDAHWLSLEAVANLWESSPGAGDGVANFVEAGPGVGSPDDSGSRTSRLQSVPAMPVATSAMLDLVGRRVCAVVYRDAIAYDEASQSADLSGPTLGAIAFTVTGLEAGGTAVSVTIEDTSVACAPSIVAGTP